MIYTQGSPDERAANRVLSYAFDHPRRSVAVPTAPCWGRPGALLLSLDRDEFVPRSNTRIQERAEYAVARERLQNGQWSH